MTHPSAGAGPPTVPHPRSPVHDVVAGLAVSIRHRPDDTVARVVGELDAATATQFVAALDDALGACVAREPASAGGTVWCDLADVTFMSLSGVTALETVRGAARERGVSLHLVSGSRPVRRVLSLVESTVVIHSGGVPASGPPGPAEVLAPGGESRGRRP